MKGRQTHKDRRGAPGCDVSQGLMVLMNVTVLEQEKDRQGGGREEARLSRRHVLAELKPRVTRG